jgi:outer membrane lipoprotein carrier protein
MPAAIRHGLAILPGLLGSLLLPLSGVTAGAGTPLDRYLGGLQSLRAEFTQVVVDARGQEIERGTGLLAVQRPGRFSWEYAPQTTGADAGQLLVADGSNLWFYDRELAQVTVRPVDEALSATPIVLLSGTAAELDAAFAIELAPRSGGLDWVRVTPRSASADFARAELAFKGATLARMVISDRLGQTVTLQFGRSARNVALPATQFQFAPPPGVDLIGSAQH